MAAVVLVQQAATSPDSMGRDQCVCCSCVGAGLFMAGGLCLVLIHG
jgi:hypothetical protein